MKYPSFFLDTNKIKSIRRDAQKSHDKDELTAFYLVRPWSIYISLFLKKYTKISANSVTFVMMSFSNIDQLLLITPLLFYVLYSLDMIDGELARLRKKTSKL
ncbi:CDP-alcohol phosphatidyltransferase family protein, partial [Flavobacteriaceae bacterium]|nr:CDP-alcohol phosphatidyltransferase family protein [Flavobacteriaceae bacterium]